jgi:CCR4-NOT transcription complex subunit 7/8
MTNGFTDPSRGGATIAERDDRSSAREVQNQTPGPNGGSTQQTQPGADEPQPASRRYSDKHNATGYGPLTNGPAPYLRTMVGGGR